MNSFRRRCFIILVCSAIVLILYWTHSKHSVSHVQAYDQVSAAEDAVHMYNENTAELPSSRATVVHNSSSLLTRHSANDDDNDYVSTGGSETVDNDDNEDNEVDDDSLSQLSNIDNSRTQMTDSNTNVSSLRQFPTFAGVTSSLLSDVSTPYPLNRSSVSLLLPPTKQSLGGERQLLNHVIVSEKRRLAAQKQRLRKLRFDKELADIMREMKKGGVLEVRKKPVPALASLSSIDSHQWQGLNMSFLHAHYPGIIPVKDYILAEHFIVNDTLYAAGMQGHPQSIDDMTDGQIEDRFYQLVSKVHVDCLEMRRMGSFDDGGYDLCTSPPYHFPSQSSCLVYSFGINFDFTFDDAMAAAFGCTIKCFDPSMTVADYLRSAKVHFYQLGLGAINTVTDRGWRLMTLSSIQSKLGHSKAVIDVLKIDIDYAEWLCLRQMLSDNSLLRVKQLIVEIHTPEVLSVGRPTSRQDFIDMYRTLTALESAGFRRYHYRYNPMGTYTSIRTGKTRTCCYELFYVNIYFLIPR